MAFRRTLTYLREKLRDRYAVIQCDINSGWFSVVFHSYIALIDPASNVSVPPAVVNRIVVKVADSALTPIVTIPTRVFVEPD